MMFEHNQPAPVDIDYAIPEKVKRKRTPREEDWFEKHYVDPLIDDFFVTLSQADKSDSRKQNDLAEHSGRSPLQDSS